MKKQAAIFITLLLTGFITYGQSFSGKYSIGKTTFTVKPLSEQDAKDGLFNIVYLKGNKVEKTASLIQDPKFEFVFDEHKGDIYKRTFYFTKTWKGKPMEGYYIRAKTKRNWL